MTVHIYSELVSAPNDFVGAIAYSLYKKTKVEWVLAYRDSHGGIDPTPAETAAFHDLNVLPTQLKGYRDRGAILAAEFLVIATQDRINEITTETQRGALAGRFETTHQALADAINSMQTELARKRGVREWGTDVVTTLIVNILAIVVVGAIAIGADRLGAFNSLLEKNLKPTPASVPATPTPTT